MIASVYSSLYLKYWEDFFNPIVRVCRFIFFLSFLRSLSSSALNGEGQTCSSKSFMNKEIFQRNFVKDQIENTFRMYDHP
jgi:hypothetical protein